MSDAEKKEKNVKLKNQVSRIEDMKKLFTFPKETVKLKVKSANPAIEDDTEEVELSKRDFEQLKKKMIINIAWPDNPVWAYSISDTLHILEINGNSLIDKTVEEIQNIIPGIDTNKLYVNFRTKDKWK